MLVKDEPKYLTVEEVAKRLRVDPETVRRWLKDDRLPGYQFGRQWRVRPDDLEKFIEESRNRGDQFKAFRDTDKWPIMNIPPQPEQELGR